MILYDILYADMNYTGESVDDMLRIKDVMKILKKSRPTIFRYIKSGKIKAIHIGIDTYFSKEEIERVLREGIII